MTKIISRFTLLPVLALVWAGGNALGQDGQGNCAGRSLQGFYAMKSVGLLYNIVLPNGDAPRLAGVGIVNFDGKGKVTFLTGVNSFQGFIVANQPNVTGTYTFDANCTGTLSFIDQFNIKESIYYVVAEGGAKLFGIYTSVNPNGKDPGSVVTVDFTRQ